MVASKSKVERSFLVATVKGLQEVDIGYRDNRSNVPATIVAKRSAIKTRNDNILLTPEFSLGIAHSSSHWRKQSRTPSTTSTISSKNSDRDGYASEDVEDKDDRIDHDSLRKCSKQLFSSNEHELAHRDSKNHHQFTKIINNTCLSTHSDATDHPETRQENVRYFSSPWDFHSPVQLEPDNFHLFVKDGKSHEDKKDQRRLLTSPSNESISPHRWTESVSPLNGAKTQDETRLGRNDGTVNHLTQRNSSIKVEHMHPIWYKENYVHQQFHFQHYQQPYLQNIHPPIQQMYPFFRPVSNFMMVPRWNTLTG